MSKVGPVSGVHMVNRMQPGGDLEHAWIMFDHVKRIKNWTTMACHVYDSAYCRVMTIVLCDIQSEDAAALWEPEFSFFALGPKMIPKPEV
jgi:hypothetical protein